MRSVVRLARPEDAAPLAELHVRTWRATYVGIVPQRVLDGLSVERRAADWRERLTDPGDRRTWVAEADGAMAGFVTAGPARDADLAARTHPAGEIYAIYVAQQAQGRGLGRALVDTAVTWLRAGGCEPIVLWVIAGNDPGARFYEHLGWRPDGARQPIDFDGTPVDEIRYRLAEG